ncbi:MAG: tetratricopeptide repeat protein [Nitrosotalea sp.]
MFCGKCGHRGYDEDNFCITCGRPLRKQIGEILDRIGIEEAELNDMEEPKTEDHDFIQEGLRLTEFGKSSQAIDSFNMAYQHDSKKVAENIYHKGLRLAECGIYSDALTCFDKAVELNPDNAEAMFAKACLLSVRGEKEAALRLLNLVVGLRPEYKESVRENQIFEKIKDDPKFDHALR